MRKLKGHYYEIFNFDKEIKEYKKLCNCKSKKFRYYPDWEEYITTKIKRINKVSNLIKFKHYIIGAMRSREYGKEQIVGIFTLFITVMFTVLMSMISIEKPEIRWVSYSFIFAMISGYIFYITNQAKSISREYYFYSDILKIIEKYESSLEGNEEA
jgi:hypothetical protein